MNATLFALVLAFGATADAEADAEAEADALAQLEKGVDARGRGDYDTAKEAFAAGLRAPGDWATNLRLELAVTHAWAGELEEALALYEEVLTTQPDNVPARNGRARTLHWQGDTKAARAGYEAVLADVPEDMEAQLGLAALDVAELKTRAARARYAAILERDPDNVEAVRGMKNVREVQRQRVYLGGGAKYLVVPGDARLGGEGRLEVRVSDRVSLHADYDGSGFVLRDPTISTTGISHVGRAGVAVKVDRRRKVTVLPRYRLVLRQDLRSHHSVPVEVYGKVSDKLVVMGALRPGMDDQGTPDLFGWAGVEAQPLQRLALVGQTFHYVDGNQTHAHAVVGRARVRAAKFLDLEAGGGWSWQGWHAGTVLGGLTLHLPGQVDVVGRYEYLRGAFERHTVFVGLGLRF